MVHSRYRLALVQMPLLLPTRWPSKVDDHPLGSAATTFIFLEMPSQRNCGTNVVVGIARDFTLLWLCVGVLYSLLYRVLDDRSFAQSITPGAGLARGVCAAHTCILK